VVDDIVERIEDEIGKPVLPHELPDIFLAVEFGRARWQWMTRSYASVAGVPGGALHSWNYRMERAL
jgi:hypothetical protein